MSTGYRIINICPQDVLPYLQQLSETATYAFGTPITEGEMREHLGDGCFLVLKGEEIAGFASYEDLSYHGHEPTREPLAIRYFSGAFVHPEHQGNGLYRQLMQERIGQGIDVYATRTQNPKVVYEFLRAMQEMGYETYPLVLRDGRVFGREIPQELQGLAEFLAGKFGKGNLIGRMYEGQLVRNMPEDRIGLFKYIRPGQGEGVVLFAVKRDLTHE